MYGICYFLVYEVRGALWVRCEGNLLSLRHFFGRRSLDIHTHVCSFFIFIKLFVARTLGSAEKGRSKTFLLILLGLSSSSSSSNETENKTNKTFNFLYLDHFYVHYRNKSVPTTILAPWFLDGAPWAQKLRFSLM